MSHRLEEKLSEVLVKAQSPSHKNQSLQAFIDNLESQERSYF